LFCHNTVAKHFYFDLPGKCRRMMWGNLFFSGVKRSDPEAHHSPSSSAEIVNPLKTMRRLFYLTFKNRASYI
jgi:hypothetical protein